LGNVQTQIKKKPFSVMKNLLLAFVLLFPFLTIAQNPQVYEGHEVDSVAIPRGGYPYLTTFINANLQIPYMAKVAKVNGNVSLAGVVDEQGKISQIEVIKGIRPDCDKEAVRVFGLFNAWQAALKGGNKVKQKIFCRIPFKSTEGIVFVDGVQLQYFDSGYTPITDNTNAQYVQKIVIDTLTGFAKDNIDFFEIKNNKKEKLITSFTYKKEKFSKNIPQYPDDLTDSTFQRYAISYYTSEGKKVKESMIFLSDSTLQLKQLFVNGIPDFPLVTYFKNGMVKEMATYIDPEKGLSQKTVWYPNGQVLRIIQYEKNPKMPYPVKSYIVNQWDDDGKQILKNGQGEAIFKTYGDSYKVNTASGKILDFQKDGVWIEKTEDGFVNYKEFYKNAKLDKGISYSLLGDSVAYSGNTEAMAEFKGGMPAFAGFLQKYLSYPSSAQKINAQGNAYVQFVVCTDGSLCDYEVVKSAGNYALDEEALRVVKKTSGLWRPGSQRGRKVRSRFTVPINFVIPRY
jgi:TonB family protein